MWVLELILNPLEEKHVLLAAELCIIYVASEFLLLKNVFNLFFHLFIGWYSLWMFSLLSFLWNLSINLLWDVSLAKVFLPPCVLSLQYANSSFAEHWCFSFIICQLLGLPFLLFEAFLESPCPFLHLEVFSSYLLEISKFKGLLKVLN